MKKAIYVLLMVIVFVACDNDEVLYPDYKSQSIYFPFQYPVRTLSLGNDRIDNSMDKQHKFSIGVCVGGLYKENTRNWTVNFEVDNSLVQDYLVNGSGDTLKILPPHYYTLSNNSSVVIPKGSFSGLMQVQLTDAFFQDPYAVKGVYVIPLKIKESPDAVSIIRGTPAENITNPNRHKIADWSITPKDYTLFGVKYVNPYHGTWLRRGKMEVKTGGSVTNTVVYRTPNVEFDLPVVLTTTSLQQVTIKGLNVQSESWNISLTVANDKSIAVQSLAGSPISITGTGKYVENGDTWGGTPGQPTPRDVIYLKYSYTRTGGDICEVSDTIVFRDRGIKVEETRPELK